MKFVISTQEFNFLIGKCLNIISQKPTIPILSNLLIEAINGELILTATDLTVGIQCRTEAKILEEGATTLPAKRLAQLVRELTAVNLEVSTADNDMTEIIADSSRFKLHGVSQKEFPALPDLQDAIHFQVKQSDLKNMLYRTAFAVSREDNRYVLTGVFLQIQDGQAIFVGTDGKRLARAFMPIEFDKTFKGSYVIPLKAVEEIVKNLADDGEVRVFLMNDKIAFSGTNITMISKLLSGDYPDVQRVIPESSETSVSLHRDELMALLRQIALFTNEKQQSVCFSLSNGELLLTANSADVGEGKVSMPANYQGPKLDIAFNPAFFIDFLRHCKEEIITMGLTDAFNPGIITEKDATPVASLAASPLYILMPMRLNKE